MGGILGVAAGLGQSAQGKSQIVGLREYSEFSSFYACEALRKILSQNS